MSGLHTLYNIRKFSHTVIGALLALALLGCSSANTVPTHQNFTEIYLLQDIDMFTTDTSSSNSNHMARAWYFSDYIKEIPNLKIKTGLYESQGQLLAAHLFRVNDVARGTIIAVHGYVGDARFSHFRHLAKRFVQLGFNFVVLNLPGHGFSGGNRGAIEDFADYGTMIHDFLVHTEGQLGEDIIMVGHSTGSVAIYEAYINYPEIMSQVDGSILISPYRDLASSRWLFFGARVIDGIKIKENKRPMELTRIPGGWIDAQREWSERIREYPVLDEHILVLFGIDDDVIDFDSSTNYYKEALGDSAEIAVYLEQDHTLTRTRDEGGVQDVRNKMETWIRNTIR